MSDSKHSVSFALNGQPTTLRVHARLTALEALRRDRGCVGVANGCEVGECGACTIVVDGAPTLSCLLLAVELHGCEVTTIEREGDERIERLRDAFLREGAVQCGFCSPGMIMAASRLPSGARPADIRAALSGNVCRCTGYAAIVRAIESALSQGDP